MPRRSATPTPGSKPQLLAVSIIVVLAGFMAASAFQLPGYPYKYIRCIGYLREGTLYGGQPECEQGPAVFAVGLALSSLGEGMIQPASNVLLIALNAACLYMILLLVRPKGRGVTAAVALIYLFAALQPGLVDPATMLAAAALLASMLLFLGPAGGLSLAASSLFGALALMAKMTALSVMAGMFAAFLLSEAVEPVKARRGVRVNVSRLRQALVRIGWYLSVPAAAVLALRALYPNSLVYSFLTHQYNQQLGYLGALAGIISTSPLESVNVLQFYLLLAGACAYYLRSGDMFAAVYAVALFATFVTFYRNAGSPLDIITFYHAMFPLLMMVVVAGRYLAGVGDGKKRLRLCVLFAAAALVFGDLHAFGGPDFSTWVTYQLSGYDAIAQDVSYLRGRIDGVYSVLPANRGRVLVDQEMLDILSSQTTRLDMGLVDNRNNPESVYRYLDTWSVPGLVAYGAVQPDPHFEINGGELDLARSIDAGAYEMMLISPAAWDSMIMYAFRNASQEAMDRYCVVYLPVFEKEKNVRHWSTLLFSNQTQCAQLLMDGDRYLTSQFDDVCAKDEWAANYIMATIFTKNGRLCSSADPNDCWTPTIYSKQCASGADVLDRYDAAARSSSTKKWAAAIAVAAFYIISRKP
jgi:hypothetical protein